MEEIPALDEPMDDAVPDESPKQSRERSTIQFPYNDLDEAVTVANSLYNNVGAGTAELHQLAGWMDQTITSGAFRNKIGAARIFGLIKTADGRATLTQVGREIVNSETAKPARVEAFLLVPLYRAIFEKYKGQPLPPNVGLEREMADLGVAEKQKDRARQAFQRSAEQAGFFSQGKTKLVLPVSPARTLHEAPADHHEEPGGRAGGGGESKPPKAHPFIQGLVDTLPPAYSEWPQEKQDEWIAAAKAIFRIIYPGGPTSPSAPPPPDARTLASSQD